MFITSGQALFVPRLGKKFSKTQSGPTLVMFLLLAKVFLRWMIEITITQLTSMTKHCDCRRWNLTGIPCSHAISCLRHERIPAEDIIHQYYTTETYSAVYGFNVMPCADKTNWMKMDGPKVEPPIYEKKIGRPPKSRRKQPHEI